MLKLPKDNPLLIILVLMLLGFIIRIYSLATQSLWIDEGFSLNAALSILKHGVPLMDSGSYYLGYLLHTYLLSLFILIFRNEIFAGRFLSVLFGTLTIPLTYYLGKEIVNKKVGLFAAVLVTFSIWEIAWSRQARMYAQFQFFYLLSLLFFYRFIQNKEAKTLALTVLFTLLTVLSHTLGYTLFLIYFIYLLVYREYFRLILTKLFKIRRLYLIIIPLFLFIAYTAVKILFSSDFLWMNYFSSYIYYMKKTSPMFLYLGIIGSFLLLKKNLKSGILLFLSILIPFLFISYLVFMIHYRYLFPIIPLLFISTAVTIDYIALLFKKKIVIALIIIVLLFGVLFNGFVFIPKKEYDLEKATPQPNFEKAYNYVKKDMDNKTIIDGFPSTAKLYLGRVDYGLKFSLSGMSNNETYDVYTGIPYIDINTLKNTKDCYLIIDKLAYRRIDPKIREFIDKMTLVEEASESKDAYSGIMVYKCKAF